jgi:putative tryptophan/tyrosine transport system substrate-binding protein
MKRREFMALLSGTAAALPLTVRAQQTDRMHTIGVLMNLPESNPKSQPRISALRDGLRKLGWVDGRNLQIVTRWGASDLDHATGYAAEFVAIKPEVIFAGTTVPLTALHQATQTIPIVFAQTADPVSLGFVASIRHPGGNITGFAQFEYSFGAEWVDLLTQMSLRMTRIAVLYDPSNKEFSEFVPAIEAAARSHTLRVSSHAVRSSDEIEHTIDTFALEPNGGLILLPGPIMAEQRELIVSLATKHRLPNTYSLRLEGGTYAG